MTDLIDVLDARTSGGQLPPFARARAAIGRRLAALLPPARITVSEAAARWRRLDTTSYRGPWRNEVAPYMVEPMNMATSRRFNALAFVGPARSGKTDALILNPILHGALADQRNMLIVHINKDSARDFSLEKVGPMIEASPALRERRVSARDADNIFDKRFVGGMRLSIGWPVLGKLSARDLPFVAFSDYDRMNDDIGDEGQPFALGRKRTQTFGSRGMTVAESSPGRPILDEDWTPRTPHEAPPTTGILALYNRGTRARFYWRCPHCGDEFEPAFERLRWPQDTPPGEAAARTVMACPQGCEIEPYRRNDLNNAGRWLHETDAGGLVAVDDPAVRNSDIVSYWLLGPAACFQSWPELVRRELDAQVHLAATGDESLLKATRTLDQGRPFLSRAYSEGGMSEEKLRAKAERRPVGLAPAATRFVTMQVDVQANRFVVQVDAWGPGLERWLVDRFDLFAPPDDAPNAASRALDPARYVEDWAALDHLRWRVTPVDGSGRGLMPMAIGFDTGGPPGVTDRAYAFWRRMKRAGEAWLWRPVKGVAKSSARDARRAEIHTVETSSGRRRTGAIPLLMAWADRLKDDIAASLMRDAPGPGAYHLPEGIDAAVFAELTAERRDAAGHWERKAGGRRNEALDLAAYGKALAIVAKAEKIDWNNPPDWAAPVERNSLAVACPQADAAAFGEATASAPPDDTSRPAVARSPFGRVSRVRRVISRGIN